MPTLRSGLRTLMYESSELEAGSTAKQQTDPVLSSMIADTVQRSRSVIESTSEASSIAESYINQAAPLPRLTKSKPTCRPIQVVHTKCTISWLTELLNERPEYRGKTAFVNNASSVSPGGLTKYFDAIGGRTTEHILCATSTYRSTLQQHEESFPRPAPTWPDPGPHSRDHKQITIPAIVSPAVTIFKSGPNEFALLPVEKRATVAVISIEAPRNVSEDNVDGIIELGHKLIAIFRHAAGLGKTVIVLGDFGCGDTPNLEKSKRSKTKRLRNDPEQVAELVLHIAMNDEEFLGYFEEIFLVSEESKVAETFEEVITLGELGVNLGVI